VEVYIDESGHATQGDVFVLGGVGGTSRQWEGFADDWNAILRSAGLMEPFHAVEFEGAREEWEQFRDRRDEWRRIHDGLTDVIIGHKLTMMGVGVPLPLWREMDEESRRKNDPYLLATEAMVSGLARDSELTTGGALDLAFYFEKRKDTAAAAERMFTAIRNHPLVERRTVSRPSGSETNNGRSYRQPILWRTRSENASSRSSRGTRRSGGSARRSPRTYISGTSQSRGRTRPSSFHQAIESTLGGIVMDRPRPPC
jgi:hypothetical protein